MASMGLRERKKQQTRRRIVDAALRRFAKHGYEATTIEDIASDADVSVTTFFRYFRAKDEVLFVDTDRRVTEFRAVLAERPLDEPDLVAIHQALRTFHQQAGGDDDARRLQRHRVETQSPVLRGRATEVAARWRQEVADGLAQRRGVSPDSPEIRLTAAIAFTIFNLAEDEWSRRDGGTDWLTILGETFNTYAALAAEGFHVR